MSFNSRLLAGLTAVAMTTTLIPAAIAADLPDREFAWPAPTAAPSAISLGVGADATAANLNWITEAGITGQSIQFAPKGTAVAEGTTVAATSKDVDINITENYKDRAPETYYPVAEHKAVITGLEEDTEYTYRVGSEASGWSEEFSFNTGTFGDEWQFTFVGDPQLYINKMDKNLPGWTNSITKATADGKSSFILSAGDQSNYSNYQEHAGFLQPAPMRSHRVAVNMGNHEMVDAETYHSMYNRPNVQDENYFFEYNNVLVISLDSNDWMDVNDDVAFLKDTVAKYGADKDWTILTYHHSSFSQAYHMEDDHIEYWRDNMVPEISAAGVDLVLGGHDHIYTRSHLMVGNHPVDRNRKVEMGEVLTPKEGEVQYIAMNSSSGSKFYDFFDFMVQNDEGTEGIDPAKTEADKTVRDYTAKWEQDYSQDYMTINVSPEKLAIKVTDALTGDVEDEFSLAKAAAEDKGDKSDSSSTAGIIAAVLGVLAAIGGVAFAGLNGMIPGVDVKGMAAQFGVKF